MVLKLPRVRTSRLADEPPARFLEQTPGLPSPLPFVSPKLSVRPKITCSTSPSRSNTCRGARCLADSVKTPRPHSPLCPGHRRCSPTASLGVGVQSSGRLPRFAPSARPSLSVSFPPAPRLAQGDRARRRAIAMWPAAFYCVTQPRGRARGSRNL